jgi:hypothetical protein
MRRECLVLWVSANDLLAGAEVGRAVEIKISPPGAGIGKNSPILGRK